MSGQPIMNFVAQLKLTHKLLLLVTIPIVVTLGFGLYQSYNAFRLQAQSEKLEHLVDFGVKASNLVHEIQKERGMTAGFIGSNGKNFADKIVDQRKATDEKLAIFNQFLSKFDIGDINPEFAQDTHGVLQNLTKLDEKRQSVNKLAISLGEALAYYTASNDVLLGLIEQVSYLAPSKEIASMISAYANYLQSKERAGIERAVLTNVFSKDQFTGNLFNRFTSLVNTQEIYTRIFLSMARDKDIDFYYATMVGEFIDETAGMRALAMSSASRTSLINELSKLVGYGGIIHSFKNYVLRGSEKYRKAIESKIPAANKILDEYQSLPGVSDLVRKDIQTVRNMLDSYRKAAETTTLMLKSGSSVSNIDAVIKISDGPAIKAIERLGKGNFNIDPGYWFEMQTGKINLLKKVEDNLSTGLAGTVSEFKSAALANLITTSLIALLGTLVSIILAVLISRNLQHQIGGEPSEIENIANQIAEGSLSYENKEGAVTGVYAAMITLQQKLKKIIETDIQSIVETARQGDLSKRIELDDKSGFYKRLGKGINDLVESNEAIVEDTVRVLAALAKGDLNQTITRDYQGSFNQLKQDANSTVDKLRQVIERDIQSVTDATLRGDLTQRIDLSDKQGLFKSMSSGINQLAESVSDIFKDVSDTMNSMSQGDLTQPIENNYHGQFDDLKNDINKTIGQLESVVTGLNESSDVVSSTSQEISEGNNSLSGRTEGQASALEQTAATMEELTSTVRDNANNTEQANQLAVNAKQTAEKGSGVLSEASKAMEEINQSSQKISEIIGVIDEIAFQTNLLALNASVEAARAGEQGRGFAVVATEVRNLAGRSAVAAKEIKDLISDSVTKVKVGVELVDQSNNAQLEIIDGITKVEKIMAEISNSSQEQSNGIEQVNTAVSSMDSGTQQNAALAEQTSAAAMSLTEQAKEMNKMMGFFTVSKTSRPNVTAKVSPGTAKPQSKKDKEEIKDKPPLKMVASGSVDDEDWEEF
ncbi:MAG: hypothetical protein GY806_13205 [Gammaproteobacteria bacterium]|nr:hypothetical protein [Gammaproteobacteria bacterium]